MEKVIIIAVMLGVLLFVKLHELIYDFVWNRLRLSLRFSKRAAFEGETLELNEMLSNATPVPLPWVALKFQVSRDLIFSNPGDIRNAQVSDYYYRNDVFGLMMFQMITRKLSFVCGKRGFYTVKSADLVGGNLLLNNKIVSHVQCDTALIVYPKPLQSDWYTIPYKKISGEILTRRFILPDLFEFKSIREYQPRDGLRSVNFKATARTGHLMSNVYDYTTSQQIIIILNLQPYASWNGDVLFEQAIRLAASIAERCVSDGIACGLVSNGKDIITKLALDIKSGAGKKHLCNIYEALARIDTRSEAAPLILDKSLGKTAYDAGDTAFFLISAYHGNDLLSAFSRLCANYPAIWVIPAFKDTNLTPATENIMKWEVADNEQGTLYY
ncbi:MAG: DUF58 domain-containing protein [Clostridiales bacterium]|nr:DUF58 domain-containing protein [Clostridiales bacterium]